jgi:hypothetical protein
MYGNPVQMPRQTSAQMQDEIMARRLALAQQNARKIVSRYNRDPRSMSTEETDMAQQLAQQFGYSTAQGRKKDKPNIMEKAGAFAGGAIDAALFDILKDEWYSARGTGDYKKAGKIAGLVGGVAIGAVPGAAKAAGGVAKSVIPKMAGVFGKGKTAELVGKALTTYMKYGTAPGVARGTAAAIGRGIAGAKAGAGGVKGIFGDPRKYQLNIYTSALDAGASKQVARAAAANAYKMATTIGKARSFAGSAAPVAGGLIGGMGLLGQVGRSFSEPYDDSQMLPQMPGQQF